HDSGVGEREDGYDRVARPGMQGVLQPVERGAALAGEVLQRAERRPAALVRLPCAFMLCAAELDHEVQRIPLQLALAEMRMERRQEPEDHPGERRVDARFVHR